MEHGTVILRANLVLPISHDPLPDGEVVVEHGRIVEVRPRSTLAGDEVLEFGDAIVMPGLINGHSHLEYTALRGWNDRVPFLNGFAGWCRSRRNAPRSCGCLRRCWAQRS